MSKANFFLLENAKFGTEQENAVWESQEVPAGTDHAEEDGHRYG